MGFFDSEIVEAGEITMALVVKTWGDELVNQLLYSLGLEGLDNGDLAKSIRYEITKRGEGLNFKLFFDDYGVFQDEGVKGTGVFGETAKKNGWYNKAPSSRFSFKNTPKGKPSVKHFRTWASQRGLNPFVVRESVWRQGLKPKRWFSRIIDENPFEELTTNLTVVGSQGVEQSIKDILENNGNNSRK